MIEIDIQGDEALVIQTREGQKMPAFEDKYGKKHHAYRSLLKRDDNGSVFVLPK